MIIPDFVLLELKKILCSYQRIKRATIKALLIPLFKYYPIVRKTFFFLIFLNSLYNFKKVSYANFLVLLIDNCLPINP